MTDLVADAYASIPQLRTFVRDAATSDAQDPDAALKLLALESAARAIERACERVFTVQQSNATARVFTPVRVVIDRPYGAYPFYAVSPYYELWQRRYMLPIDDLASTSGMSVAFDATGNGNYTNTQTANYRLLPYNNPDKGLPYEQLTFNVGVFPPLNQDAVQVTAKWGWTAVPNTIVNANLLQAARFLKRRDAPFGIAGSPEMGSEMRLLAKLDPDVLLMVSAFRRSWGAV